MDEEEEEKEGGEGEWYEKERGWERAFQHPLELMGVFNGLSLPG